MSKVSLWIMEYPVEKCSRCGEPHKENVIKELNTKFNLTENIIFTHYKMFRIGTYESGKPMEEPRPLVEYEDGAIEFKTPIVIEVEDGTIAQYGGWGWCRVNDEPIFFHMTIKFKENDDDKSQEN